MPQAQIADAANHDYGDKSFSPKYPVFNIPSPTIEDNTVPPIVTDTNKSTWLWSGAELEDFIWEKFKYCFLSGEFQDEPETMEYKNNDFMMVFHKNNGYYRRIIREEF